MTGKDLIYSAYEISCLMDSKRICSDFLASLLRIISIPNSNYVSVERIKHEKKEKVSKHNGAL